MAQRITYAGGQFLMADVVADALLDFALGLSKRALVEIVDVRVRRLDGSIGRMRLLLGDGMPMATETTREEMTTLDGDAEDKMSADDIRRRTAELGRSPLLRLDGDGHNEMMSVYDDL
jgi:hypothetical protein